MSDFSFRNDRLRKVVLGVVLSTWCIACSVLATEVRVLPNGELPPDSRLGPLKDLNGYFPFKVPSSIEEWELRAGKLRTHLLVMTGLWPLPSPTDLNPVIHGKVDQGDYTVEKVYFESFPGFFVTGSLYRPKNTDGPHPGVLSPHGHWANGRFMDNNNIWGEVNQGAERFENGGRSPLQSRNVQLARMGCVVFHYDMIGYADSQQISQALAHGFSKQRPDMNDDDRWGFFSPQAEARLQNIMGLQTWNSIRSLDFLLTLSDVDPNRLAITGASGGGTQSFMMGAIDNRLSACFPAVMVSTAMQGGCTCENASGLRIPLGNVEIAALMAPKPLGMTGAEDWTVEMSNKGFPELKRLYEMYEHPDLVSLTQLNHFGHNYNYVSRSAMYHFMDKHLNLNLDKPIVEQDYERQTSTELTVWTNGHTQPEGGPEFERELLQYWHRDAQKKLQASQQSIHAFRNLYGPGIESILGRSLETAGKVQLNLTRKVEKEEYIEVAGMLKNTSYEEAIPVLFLFPNEWNGRTIIWPTDEGKSGLLNQHNSPIQSVQDALDAGCTVIGMDLLFQGEFVTDKTSSVMNRTVSNPREFAGYTYGYNHPLFAQRVHDLLSVIQYVRTNTKRPSKSIELIGMDGAGHWAAAARAVCRDIIHRAVIDTQGFRFADITDYKDSDFLHGGVKFGDIPGMLGLAAPSDLILIDEGNDSNSLLTSLYRSAGFPSRLRMDSQLTPNEAVTLLLNANHPDLNP